MKRQAFAEWLHKVADAVQSGDSAEGSVQWLLGEAPDDVSVGAAVRTGNLEGQGGYATINEVPAPAHDVFLLIDKAPSPDVLSALIDLIKKHGALMNGMYPEAYDRAIADVVELLEGIRGP